MKKLKQIVAIIMCVVLLICLTACNKSSDLSMDVLEMLMQLADSDVNFKETKTDSGYSFSHTTDSFVLNISYKGTANSDKMVDSVTVVHSDIDVSRLTNKTELSKILSTNANDMRMDDIRIGYCLSIVRSLYCACKGSAADAPDFSEFFSMFTSGETKTVNGWTISIKTNSSANTCTITATYN